MIDYNEKQKKFMRSAYKFIFNLSDEDLSAKEHRQRMVDAINEVHQYTGTFEGEDQVLAEARRQIKTDSAGQFITDLSEHFKKLYPEMKKKSSYKLLYEMYNRMNTSDTGSDSNSPKENNVDAATQGQSDLGNDDSDKMKTNEIVVQGMEEEEMAKTWDEAANEMQQGLGADEGEQSILGALNDKANASGTTVAKGSNVKPSDISSKAARDVLEKTQAERNTRSMNTVATKLVISTIPQKDRLVNAENAKGYIKPEAYDRVFRKFCEVTGCKEVQKDVYEFQDNKLQPGEQENARNMLNLLIAVKTNPNTPIDINESKSTGTIKGFEVKMEGEAPKYMEKDAIRDWMVRNTSGFIAGMDGAALQIAKAGAVKEKKNKKPSDKAINVTEIQDANKIMILKVTNRKDMMANDKNIVYWKDKVGDEQEEASGCKSALAVKCYGKKDNVQTNITYRLPLTALMYKTAVIDENIKAVFQESKGLGVKFDINSETDKEKQFNELQEVLALLADSKVESEGISALINDIKNSGTEAKAQRDAAIEAAY